MFAGPGGLHKGGKYCQQQQQVQRFLGEVAASFLSFRAPERRGVTLGWTDGQSSAFPWECGICWLLAGALRASPVTRERIWGFGELISAGSALSTSGLAVTSQGCHQILVPSSSPELFWPNGWGVLATLLFLLFHFIFSNV